MADSKKPERDDYWERLRFSYHQAAMRCVTEREFTNAMYMMDILPGRSLRTSRSSTETPARNFREIFIKSFTKISVAFAVLAALVAAVPIGFFPNPFKFRAIVRRTPVVGNRPYSMLVFPYPR